MPPAGLVAWTEYFSLLAGTIAAVRGLWHGGSALYWKAEDLRGKHVSSSRSAGEESRGG
jgi:hypothetical protein